MLCPQASRSELKEQDTSLARQLSPCDELDGEWSRQLSQLSMSGEWPAHNDDKTTEQAEPGNLQVIAVITKLQERLEMVERAVEGQQKALKEEVTLSCAYFMEEFVPPTCELLISQKLDILVQQKNDEADALQKMNDDADARATEMCRRVIALEIQCATLEKRLTEFAIQENPSPSNARQEEQSEDFPQVQDPVFLSQTAAWETLLSDQKSCQDTGTEHDVLFCSRATAPTAVLRQLSPKEASDGRPALGASSPKEAAVERICASMQAAAMRVSSPILAPSGVRTPAASITMRHSSPVLFPRHSSPVKAPGVRTPAAPVAIRQSSPIIAPRQSSPIKAPSGTRSPSTDAVFRQISAPSAWTEVSFSGILVEPPASALQASSPRLQSRASTPRGPQAASSATSTTACPRAASTGILGRGARGSSQSTRTSLFPAVAMLPTSPGSPCVTPRSVKLGHQQVVGPTGATTPSSASVGKGALLNPMHRGRFFATAAMAPPAALSRTHGLIAPVRMVSGPSEESVQVSEERKSSYAAIHEKKGPRARALPGSLEIV